MIAMVSFATSAVAVLPVPIAHIVVAGKTDRRAVRLDVGVGAFFEKSVKRRSVCQSYGIAESRLGLANAVHNDQNKFFHIIFLLKKSNRP